MTPSEPVTDDRIMTRLARKLRVSRTDLWSARTVPDGYVAYVHEGGESMWAARVDDVFSKVGKRHYMQVRDYLFEREKVYG